MFVRLTRRKRVKAGWLAALLYLFCVLAPGVALAAGDAASCLVHQLGTAASTHGHDGPQPEHAASHQHHEMQADQHALHQAARDRGMVSMYEMGAIKVWQGLTTIEEVLRATRMG